MNSDGHKAGLFLLDDPDWRRKVFESGLWLCIPVLGWPAILGYRSALAEALFGHTPRLPDWKGNAWRFVGDGLRAMGVIFGYLAPLYVVLGLVARARGFEPDARFFAAALVFLLLPIFSTLSLPVAAMLLAYDGLLSKLELILLAVAFAAVVYIVPAGFLQVTRTGRFRSAFALHKTLPFVVRNWRSYGRAWSDSLWISMAGHLALPVAPWGVTWAYIAIIHSFNAVLERSAPRDAGSWMAATLRAEQSRGPRGVFRRCDAGGGECTILRFRHFSVPLPRCLEGTFV